MAIPPHEVMQTINWSDWKIKTMLEPSPFVDEICRRRKTVGDVERDVAKLKSLSEAGRKSIVDERCSWLGIGRHAGKIRFRMKR